MNTIMKLWNDRKGATMAGIRSNRGSIDPGGNRGIHEPGLDHRVEDRQLGRWDVGEK